MYLDGTARNARMQTFKRESEVKDELITVKELCKWLKFHKKTVYELLQKGAIPGATKVGSAWRIHRATVLAWVSGQVRVSSPRRHK